jgi:PAS domain S-box-containing protein
MDTDRNLLFGVLALQADVLNSDRFIKACTLWTTRKEVSMPSLLIELGWITPTDRADVERLLERKLRKHGGNPKAGLAAVADDIKRSLAGLQDADIQQSLADLPGPDDATTMVAVDAVPRLHERYALTRLHASGGIGRIWLARDIELGRDVALKELRPERAEHAALSARFLQEAKITSHLEHPGIVPVYELARRSDNQQPFYTMRFVKGRTLTEVARAYHQKRVVDQADALDLPVLLNAFVTVCNTVAYAHSRGIIHRDLKGQNVVLGDFGEVVVLDWGLAKRLDEPYVEADVTVDSLAQDQSREMGLTVQGQTMGTPAYMAPEQAEGRLDLIARHTDIYGLGAILYEILTGQPPFADSDTQALLQKVREGQPAPPRQLWNEVPAALEAICLRAIAKRPADRYNSASELAREVQGWQEMERREAEQERDRFFTLSLDMLCIADFDGYFRRLNPAWERTLGFAVEELLREPFMSFIHPDDREQTQAEMEGLRRGAEIIRFENRYRCKDGSYKWMMWTAAPFTSRGLVYSAARDITARKRAEEDLRGSEGRYRSVIAATQEGIVLLDADGSIRACNASAERILGLSADQMVGRTTLDPRWRAIHEDGSPFPGETHPAWVTLHTGQPLANVVMGVHKPDGALTWILVNSQPLFDGDGTTLTGVVASFADITERKEIQATLEHTTAELAAVRRTLADAIRSRP